MTRKILLTALIALVVPAAAQAHTTIIEPGGSHFPYQRWADESKIPTPDASLTVVETDAAHGCPGRELNYVACTAPWENVIWLAPEAIAGDKPRLTFLHELGHNADADLLPQWMRNRFMEVLRLSGPWVVEAEPKPYSPDEEFADVYAQCAVDPCVPPQHLGIQPLGGPVTHNKICRMLAHL